MSTQILTSDMEMPKVVVAEGVGGCATKASREGEGVDPRP